MADDRSRGNSRNRDRPCRCQRRGIVLRHSWFLLVLGIALAMRRWVSVARIFARCASSARDQTVISSRVRKQPRHRPLLASIWQILMQGEGIFRFIQISMKHCCWSRTVSMALKRFVAADAEPGAFDREIGAQRLGQWKAGSHKCTRVKRPTGFSAVRAIDEAGNPVTYHCQFSQINAGFNT